MLSPCGREGTVSKLGQDFQEERRHIYLPEEERTRSIPLGGSWRNPIQENRRKSPHMTGFRNAQVDGGRLNSISRPFGSRQQSLNTIWERALLFGRRGRESSEPDPSSRGRGLSFPLRWEPVFRRWGVKEKDNQGESQAPFHSRSTQIRWDFR